MERASFLCFRTRIIVKFRSCRRKEKLAEEKGENFPPLRQSSNLSQHFPILHAFQRFWNFRC
ncbi:hypothetical protein EDM59_17610 [Brevibacillus nitrificans]|uniref:Uncharacterized protein n=1 Tax=Brevibacillus nitrificans TaxID=651560 RepID=A0A3M8D9R7_9BACL|nr:hypothetical protein EDM59_17610 [Brevibacillus nitrificans]